MRRGSIIPAYPRLFDPTRRRATNRTPRLSLPTGTVGEETEEQLADIWESFNLYVVEDPLVQVMNKGFGFVAPWVVKEDGRQVLEDDFESYAAEDPVTSTLNGGIGWDSAFIIVNRT